MEPSQELFRFTGCSELHEILGKTAEDERRLVELIEEVPLDSIYFHTHSYFLRHSYVDRVYPNDFAQWVAMEVRDLVLGERLAVVDPFAFSNLETLREELCSLARIGKHRRHSLRTSSSFQASSEPVPVSLANSIRR